MEAIRSTDLVGFYGMHNEAPAGIAYGCRDGRIRSVLVLLDADSEEHADTLFDQQFQALTEAYGPLCTDYRALPDTHGEAVAALEEGLDFSFVDEFKLVSWTLGGNVTAMLEKKGPQAHGPEWLVRVSASGPPPLVVPDGEGGVKEMPLSGPEICLHREPAIAPSQVPDRL